MTSKTTSILFPPDHWQLLLELQTRLQAIHGLPVSRSQTIHKALEALAEMLSAATEQSPPTTAANRKRTRA
jgi:hypothetical protein